MTAQTGEGGARILLIDDHPAVRQGLALLLAQDSHRVRGEAGSRDEMLGFLAGGDIDLALLDLSLGQESGLDLIDELRRADIPVLVYSFREDAATISRALELGAAGYVTKREVSGALLNAVREVLDGRRHLSPFAEHSLVHRVLDPQDEREAALSERERQMIALLGQGRGAQEIAILLEVSVRTVESYCARACEKLGISGMKELRRHAVNKKRPSGSSA